MSALVAIIAYAAMGCAYLLMSGYSAPKQAARSSLPTAWLHLLIWPVYFPGAVLGFGAVLRSRGDA